jgi:hypothetical protein
MLGVRVVFNCRPFANAGGTREQQAVALAAHDWDTPGHIRTQQLGCSDVLGCAQNLCDNTRPPTNIYMLLLKHRHITCLVF